MDSDDGRRMYINEARHGVKMPLAIFRREISLSLGE